MYIHTVDMSICNNTNVFMYVHFSRLDILFLQGVKNTI